jgi:hypothetical protein
LLMLLDVGIARQLLSRPAIVSRSALAPLNAFAMASFTAPR